MSVEGESEGRTELLGELQSNSTIMAYSKEDKTLHIFFSDWNRTCHATTNK